MQTEEQEENNAIQRVRRRQKMADLKVILCYIKFSMYFKSWNPPNDPLKNISRMLESGKTHRHIWFKKITEKEKLHP